MAITTSDVIKRLVDEQVAKGGDVYHQRLLSPAHPNFKYIPYCVYFFYVRLNRDGSLKVDHYFYVDGPEDDPSQWKPIPYESLPEIVKRLAINGRPNQNRHPQPLENHNFERIVLTRKSYFAIYVDEANWSLHKFADNKAAVVYNEDKAGGPNHSFYDAQDIEIQMPTSSGQTDTRTGVFFVNHMKRDAAGNDTQAGDSIEFAFDLYFDVKFADSYERPITVIFDPGGTNEGPPDQP